MSYVIAWFYDQEIRQLKQLEDSCENQIWKVDICFDDGNSIIWYIILYN